MSNKHSVHNEKRLQKIKDCKNQANREGCIHCEAIIDIAKQMNELTKKLLHTIAYDSTKPNEKTLYCAMLTSHDADFLLTQIRKAKGETT